MMAGLKIWLLRLLMRRMVARMPCVSDKPENPSRIALWQFGGVGDMLLVTPVIRALEKAYPDVNVHIWCSDPRFAEFLQRFPCVQEIHCFHVYDFDSRTLMHGDVRGRLLKIRDEMREFSPHTLVNLHVPALLDWWAVEWWLVQQVGAPYSLGFDPDFIRRGSVYGASLNATARNGIHYTALYKRLLEATGIECGECTEFPLSDSEIECAEALLDEHDVTNQKKVCIHIGARRLKIEGKMWPLKCFAILAEKLVAQGYTPLLIGVESELEMAQSLCARVPSCQNLVGHTSIGEMAALISITNGFIGHDSGPFHIAVAVGTPCVAICGRPDSEPEYLNYERETVAVLAASSPDLITVDAVFDSAMRGLGHGL